MKHTQGKWLQKQVKANDRPGKVTLIGTDYEDGHLGVATVNWTDDEEGQANANLIASAPEMLLAFKFILAYYTNKKAPVADLCAEMIAKAEGRK